jgi:hypothetical protein
MRTVARLLLLTSIVVSLPFGNEIQAWAAPRSISFAGRTWDVQRAGAPVGPGPNRFSDSRRTVWVDPRGWLHLRIEERHGHWWCAAVVAREAAGYGTYSWQVAGRASDLDPNAVLGLFTWDSAAGDHHREIDVEASRWGRPAARRDVTYTVQPYTHDGNGRASFQDERLSTQSFAWDEEQIRFWSMRGTAVPPGDADSRIARWRYAGPDVPPAGDAHPRMNLWLFRGEPPDAGETVELVIRSFAFVPAAVARRV